MTGNYITIEKLKGINYLNFEIPLPGVYVITARNGSGKTTLMTCIERLQNTDAFGKHFIQQKSWNVDSYDDSKITYLSKTGNSVTYTYRNASNSWRPTHKSIQAIKDFGYNSITAIPALGKRVYTQSKTIKGGSVKAVSTSLREAMAEVLENPIFLKLLKLTLGDIRGRGGANRRNNTAFLLPKGQVRIGNKTTRTYYSESSFSLGEIFSLNLLFELEVIVNDSLIVIDELEVALHPRVQINMLRYIEKKALEKNLTVLISTHSSSLIKCSQRLIFLEKNSSNNHIDVHYNCYPTLALQEVAVEEDIQPDYVFFVEDQSAEFLLKEMIKQYFKYNSQKKQPLWKILPIGGYPEVLRFTRKVNSYLLNKKIGQYAFLDKDVEDVKSELRSKGNNRTDSENNLWELFSSQSSRIKYLVITPELGVWDWLSQNQTQFQCSLSELFPDITINTTDLLRDCNAEFPHVSSNPRDAAKSKVSWLISELNSRTNEDKKRIKQSLVMLYAENYYSENSNIGNLNSVFGPIFNRRGNG